LWGGLISGATAAILTTALGEVYIVVMEVMFKGEIEENELETEVEEQDCKNYLKN